MTARAALAKAISEEELLITITDALTLYGWRWHHVRRSDRALQMGHAGFPDVCAARKGRVLFLELKSAGGTLTEDQRSWGRELAPWLSHDVSWMVVYPQDLDVVLVLLR